MKETLARVIACVAKATRYPIELLTADADLENDLGIDSVKNLEVVMTLGEEFGLDLVALREDRSLRTLAEVARWIDDLLHATVPSQSANEQIERVDPAHVPHEPKTELRPGASRSHQQNAQTNRLSETLFNEPGRQSRPLDGRIALVTGSGRGVGRTIARLLAARGAQVIINSFRSREMGDRTAREINEQGGKATHIWGSVANPSHVDRIFDQIEEQFGQLDMLICNASDGRIGSFLELSSEDWDRAFRTNVSGHYQCAVRAARLMRTSGGSIVTLSAVGAHRYIDGLGSQGIVKAAVETMTRYLACELGPLGIRVNCVAGGPVYGDLLSKFPNAQKTQSHWESLTPDGELCSPNDLAQAIGFLVSDEARGITGSIMMVDHGFSATADSRPLRQIQREPVFA